MTDRYEKEFNYLESLSKEKPINMYYATSKLQEKFSIGREKATMIISEFINSYDELRKNRETKNSKGERL